MPSLFLWATVITSFIIAAIYIFLLCRLIKDRRNKKTWAFFGVSLALLLITGMFIAFNPVSATRLYAEFEYSLFPDEPVKEEDNKMPEDASNALAEPDKAIIFFLDPEKRIGQALHGYIIEGQSELDKQQTRKASLVFQNAVSWEGSYGVTFCLGECFYPHHALRVIKDGHIYDYVLCMICGKMKIYKNNHKIKTLYTNIDDSNFLGIIESKEVP